MNSNRYSGYTTAYSRSSRVLHTPKLMNGVATLGITLLLLISNSVSATQLIHATKLIVVDSQDTMIGQPAGNELEAIGGTRAKAIGGTRAKAIGGTRLLAIADTQVRSLGTAQLADSVHQLGILNQFESAPVKFMGEEYDWIVIGPVQPTAQGEASVLGYNVDIGGQVQSLFNDQTMVMVGSRHSDGATIALATNDTFVSGVTEVLTAARIKDIDASSGQLVLTSGVVVDYTQLLANPDHPEVRQGDYVFVQGHLY